MLHTFLSIIMTLCIVAWAQSKNQTPQAISIEGDGISQSDTHSATNGASSDKLSFRLVPDGSSAGFSSGSASEAPKKRLIRSEKHKKVSMVPDRSSSVLLSGSTLGSPTRRLLRSEKHKQDAVSSNGKLAVFSDKWPISSLLQFSAAFRRSFAGERPSIDPKISSESVRNTIDIQNRTSGLHQAQNHSGQVHEVANDHDVQTSSTSSKSEGSIRSTANADKGDALHISNSPSKSKGHIHIREQGDALRMSSASKPF